MECHYGSGHTSDLPWKCLGWAHFKLHKVKLLNMCSLLYVDILLFPPWISRLWLKRNPEVPLFAVIMAIIFAFWLNWYYGWSSSYTKLDLFSPWTAAGWIFCNETWSQVDTDIDHRPSWTQNCRESQSFQQTWTSFCVQVGVRLNSGFICFSGNPKTRHSSAVWEKFGFILTNLIVKKSMQRKTAPNSFKNPWS